MLSGRDTSGARRSDGPAVPMEAVIGAKDGHYTSPSSPRTYTELPTSSHPPALNGEAFASNVP